jgi:hypothetical protein
MKIYNLINKATCKIIGYTTISPFDTDTEIPDEELLDSRLWAAIDDGYIPDDVYIWKKGNLGIGVLI